MNLKQLSNKLTTQQNLYWHCVTPNKQIDCWWNDWMKICCDVTQYCREQKISTIESFITKHPEFDEIGPSLVEDLQQLIKTDNIDISELPLSQTTWLVVLALMHKEAQQAKGNTSHAMQVIMMARQLVNTYRNKINTET